MVRLPFFRIRTADGTLPLEIPDAVDVSFGVYFEADGPPPERGDLLAAVTAWLDVHASGPLFDAIQQYLDRDLLALAVEPKDALRAPSAETLRHMRSGDDALQRYERATHVAVISAPDALLASRTGLWCAVAAARGIASALDGVVFDPTLNELLPLDREDEDLPPDGRIEVADHILIPCSVDAHGAGWVTTLGMPKFGLPNLEIRDVPSSLFSRLAHVMNGLAQRLVDVSTAQPETTEEPARKLEIRREVRLSVEEMARAYGEEVGPRPEGVQGWALVGLDYTGRGRRGLEPFITLTPPGAARVDPGEWLYGLLGDLLGSEDPENCDYVPGDNERIEVAHRRAVMELPQVKRRYQAGLSPGQQLYVKYGFPVEDHREYMWIDVAAWKGSRLSGRLANDPFERLDLRAGQTVEIAEADVYDWMLEGPDDRHEGNFTGQIAREEGLWDS